MSNDLKKRAEQIRDERIPGNNTAERVGGVLVALAENDDQKADKDLSNVPAIKAIDVSELDSATDNGCIYLVKDPNYMFNTRYMMTVTRVDTGSIFTVQTRLSINGVEQRSKGDDGIWTSWSNILKTVTESYDGLMPSTDKRKLDSIIPVRVNVNTAINTSTLEGKGRTIPFLSEELSMADIITMTDSGFRFMFCYTYNDNGTLKTGSLDFEASYEYTQTLSFYNASKTITIDLIESSKGGQVNVEISLSE